MSQSFTFVDVAGNQAQYTISEKDQQGNFHWSTDHGDRGTDPSFEQAQFRARTLLKDSMMANRRSEETTRKDSYSSRWR